MWSLLVEPFLEYEFLRRALIEAIVLGLGFSIVGQVLITRRLSLIGDTLSHAMLPGVVVAFLLFGANAMALFWGGWITGFLILSASWFLFHRRRIEADAGLALFAVFSVSLGVLLAARTRTTTEILHLLFEATCWPSINGFCRCRCWSPPSPGWCSCGITARC
ncbi:MAG: metal ABC transporter permease [Bdellovibrionaceae bacterium]|nr:metal ABC transporter permease [Pseudobdellovibrionaceae bacterium]